MNPKEKIFKILDNIAWHKFSDKILVAVSGGADSLALTLSLNEYLKEKQKNKQLIAITVDHSLRNSSKIEAENLHKQLTNLKIRHEILTWKVKNITTAIQKQAREARFKLIEQYCLKNNINNIFLAQHLGDQIENFWLRLFKKSGVFGLSSMSFLRKNAQNNIFYIRPCLEMSKQELKEICKNYQQQWQEDPTNQSNKYTRNIIRKNLQHLPIKEKDVLRLIKAFSTIRHYMQKNTNKVIKNCVETYPAGYVELNLNIFEKQHIEIQKLILKNILCHISGNTYPPRSEKLENARKNILKRQKFTSFGCAIDFLDKNTALICREIRNIKPKIINSENFIWDERFKISCDKKYIGAEIKTLGNRGLSCLNKDEKKLYEKIYKKLPKEVKKTIPIIEKNNEVLAIPHINYKKFAISYDFAPKIPIFGVYIEELEIK